MRTSYSELTDDNVPRPILHLVSDLDGKHVDGHNRLSVKQMDFDGRIEALERSSALHDEQLKNAAKHTTDIQQLRFTPAMFAATVAICAAVIGGFYGSTSGIRSDVRDLATMMQSQATLEQERNKNTLLQVVQLNDKVVALATQVTSLEGQMREMSTVMKGRK